MQISLNYRSRLMTLYQTWLTYANTFTSKVSSLNKTGGLTCK